MQIKGWMLSSMTALCVASPTLAQEVPPPDASEVSTFRSDCKYARSDELIRRIGDRVLVGGYERWVLFDTRTRRAVASGPTKGPEHFELGGQLAIVPSDAGNGYSQQLLDVRDGHRIATLDKGWPFDMGFAFDGSYAYRYGGWTLDVWSATGQSLVHLEDRQGFASVTGDVSAQSGQFRVVTETAMSELDLTTGVFSTVLDAKNGFAAKTRIHWFEDGRYYAVSTPDGTRFYTQGDVLVQELAKPPAIGVRGADPGMYKEPKTYAGFGAFYVSIQSNTIRVFRVGGPLGPDGAPVAVLSASFDAGIGWSLLSRGSLAVVDPKGTGLQIIDLRGETPALTPKLVLPEPISQERFASDGGEWAVVTQSDSVLVRDPREPSGFSRIGCRAP